MSVEGIEKIEKAGTSAGNYNLDSKMISTRILRWSKLCELRILEADRASIKISFLTLPSDMEAFAADIYSFCPDIVDQGTGCIKDFIEDMGVPPHAIGLVEDLDFSIANHGVELLKRFLLRDKVLKLWWD